MGRPLQSERWRDVSSAGENRVLQEYVAYAGIENRHLPPRAPEIDTGGSARIALPLLGYNVGLVDRFALASSAKACIIDPLPPTTPRLPRNKMIPSRIRRRSFVKSSVVAAATLAASGPLILGAQDKAGSKDPIVGDGEFTYRCIHHWGRDSLPADHQYGNASHGVTVDRDGLIYVTHNAGRPGSIYVFDPDGTFVRSMGGFHAVKKNGSSTSSGHGIDIREENGEQFLYLAASNANMSFAKMSLRGELIWQRPKKTIFQHADFTANPKLRFRPTNTSFRPDGGYYLGDGYGSNYLYQYDANDDFVGTIGGPGEADGQFRTPHGQWLDDRDGTPKLVVADRANARLQWFDMDGKHLRSQGGFLFPADIDCRGELMLVPDLHARITILDKANDVVAQLGDDEAWRARVLDKKEKMRASPEKWQPGRFVHPHDACFDADGNIFVAEWVRGGRVTKLIKV